MILAMVAHFDLFCKTVDVKAAFLNSVIDEDIYLNPPEGSGIPPTKVVKLLKSLYGLKQSNQNFGRDFSKRLSQSQRSVRSLLPLSFLSAPLSSLFLWHIRPVPLSPSSHSFLLPLCLFLLLGPVSLPRLRLPSSTCLSLVHPPCPLSLTMSAPSPSLIELSSLRCVIMILDYVRALA